ncbi:MAG: long-chain-fatty-acid--CoA ligase [Solirubrobacterales bacterium]
MSTSAEKFPERIGVRLDDIALNYAAMDQLSQRVAGLLESKGVGQGDRVCMMLPNVPHFPMIYYAILRLGAIVVPMNVLLTSREITHYMTDSGAKLILVWNDFAGEAVAAGEETGVEVMKVDPGPFLEEVGASDPVAEVAVVEPDDTAIVLYTSGTTGSPKGAELTHDNIGSNIKAILGLFAPTENDVIFGGLPLFHIFGQTVSMNVVVRVGGELTLLPRFDPEKALEIIQRDKVTVFMGVPTMYAALLHTADKDKYDISSLRICVSGGAALPGEILKAFEADFGSPIIEGYGLSETSPVATFGRLDMEQKPGTIGVPIEGVEIRLIDDDGNVVGVGEKGEIQIKGPNVMKGYWDNPEATANAIDSDGWFSSGDIGTVDDDGYYSVVDRKKEMILRGGYNVYPREIEEVLYEHPAIREAAVLGVPHDDLGEEVVAVVSLKDGESATPDEIKAFAKEQVAAYKYPRHVEIIDDLPKGPTGKIFKRGIDTSVFA